MKTEFYVASEDRQHGNTYPLLASLLAVICVSPFAVRSGYSAALYNALLSAVIVSGVWGVSHRRRMLWIIAPLAAIEVALLWLALGTQSRGVAAASFVAGLVVVVLVSGLVLQGVFRSPRITLSSVTGGVCGYLLTGFAWAYVFALLEVYEHGSFLRHGDFLAMGQRGIQELVYYAFATLSTLGYGDIAPATPPAEGFSVLAAISGQLYLAILIAALVSRFAGREPKAGQ